MKVVPVQAGDVVDIVAPASRCSLRELRQGLAAIRRVGLVPRVSRHIFGRSLLFSNSDQQRLTQLKRAIYAKDSKLIWCVRGGYGSIRLMPMVEKWPRPAQAKIFLGYSDLTTLHVFLNQRWKWPTLHGPLIGRFGRGELTPRERRELLGILFGERGEVEFDRLKPLNAAARKRGIVRAAVVGGNLTVLQSGMATRSGLRLRNHILFVEDIGERPYRVDRMLTQMRLAGWFDQCRAVVFGDFLLDTIKDRRGLWQDVIPRFAAEVKIPVVAGLPVGHSLGCQRTLPFNTPASLHLGSHPRLVVESGVRTS